MQDGELGDMPVPGDYDGNGSDDVAVYRQATGQWFVRNQFVVQFGDQMDGLCLRDYNGDGTTDIAVYRRATGQWFVRNQLAVQFGSPRTSRCRAARRSRTRPAGTSTATATRISRSSGRRRASGSCATGSTVQFGDPGDKAVPADYNGDGIVDVAVFRPTTGHWFVRNQFAVQFGDPPTSRCRETTTATGYTMSRCAVRPPAPGTCATCWRSQFGDDGDIPVPGRLQRRRDRGPGGLPAVDAAVVRAQRPRGAVRRRERRAGAGGLQRRRPRWTWRVYRPSTGQWFVRNVLAQQFGDPTDTPVPGDYNGDGTHGPRGVPSVHGAVVRAEPARGAVRRSVGRADGAHRRATVEIRRSGDQEEVRRSGGSIS